MPDAPLKPCPFCGGTEAALEVWNTLETIYVIHCDDCGGRGPLSEAVRSAEFEKAKKSAVSRWNARVEEGVDA